MPMMMEMLNIVILVAVETDVARCRKLCQRKIILELQRISADTSDHGLHCLPTLYICLPNLYRL